MNRILQLPRRRMVLALVTSMTSLVALVGCSDSPMGAPVRPTGKSSVERMVVPALASSVDQNGRFILTSTLSQAGRREISGPQASALAVAWTAEFGTRLRRYLEAGRNAAIDFKSLSPCGRPLYARSAFEAPDPGVPLPVSRPFGPYYFVTMCDRSGGATLSIAVSAWNTDLSISKGALQFAPFQGNEFFPIGVPNGHRGEYPASPEDAATVAVKGAGRLVAKVPTLVMPSSLFGLPQSARWEVQLDSATTIVGKSGRRMSTRTAYVGAADIAKVGITHFVAEPEQINVAEASWVPLMPAGQKGDRFFEYAKTSRRTSLVRRRDDSPVRFEFATLAGGR